MLPAEEALLTGRWSSDKEKSDRSTTGAALAKLVVEGAFREALTSDAAKSVLKVPHDSHLSNPMSTWFSATSVNADDELLRLSVAVACLHAFVQVNWTGPDLSIRPTGVLNISERIGEDALNRLAIMELAYSGEPAYHLAQDATFLRIAQILLDFPFQHCESAPWWRLRAFNVHEQVLDEAVAPPPSISSNVKELLPNIADPDLKARLLLEHGLLQHHCANDRDAADRFVEAAQSTGMEYELTGALGKRTKFQQMDVTQLILLAESRKRTDAPEPNSSTVSEPNGSSSGTAHDHMPETLALNDDTLLEHTQFTASHSAASSSRLAHLDPANQPALDPLDQCILLSLCLNVRNTSPAHGLTQEQMAPYVARVISHPRNWSVHTMALLLRSRLESGRTRLVERSVLQLQALVDQMPTTDAPLSERLLYFHDIPLPSKWELERELATRFLELGVVRSALEIFERLEMWEEVVKCWQAMERHDKAIKIVRDLLEGRKAEADVVLARSKEGTSGTKRQAMDSAREAKLWCILGDLEPDRAEEHYMKAWTVSGETSGRAMRSLGGYHFARARFAEAVSCLKRAVKINPLLSRSWFVLGCACVRLEDWEGAREAFTRCVSIDDEDSESWNNLASVYLRMGEIGKKKAHVSVPFANKQLAFRALQQGVKRSYDNWRMWNNYMIVAVDVGELSEACRALGRVIEERSSRSQNESDGAYAESYVDEDVLDRLVDAVTRAPANPDDAVEGEGTARDAALNPNEGHGLYKRVLDLFDRIVLPRVSSPRVFRAYARLLTWQSHWVDALKAYMDAYRCGVAGTWERGEEDLRKWREAVSEVEEIVDVLRNFGPRAEEGLNWRSQARSVVRTFMGKTKDFEDQPEWQQLVDLQEELKKASDS
ncbi:TPR-like protein [Punctularia strigosozonata HHB-11173 SS5]|uniref:TPR-like protein n=1 Tax=Punctularia strigosozonata (strain HHB-11173) TaxID=741275 RepID=UPI00044180FF|nr:TPR-like protein [Punctularia strigosozonata HHB-11173 SS5]EIN11027.1 TPR-like protein [Punctularia strigosozonata HHB-11173 SS5]